MINRMNINIGEIISMSNSIEFEVDDFVIKQTEEPPIGTNPKDIQGIKKVQLNLVPASSIIYQALGMEDGSGKYGPYNWRGNKVLASIYIAALLRHITAWYDSGEELASDSGVPHLGHALSCLGIIVDAYETGNLVDDRPTPGAASKLIEKWAAIKQLRLDKGESDAEK